MHKTLITLFLLLNCFVETNGKNLPTIDDRVGGIVALNGIDNIQAGMRQVVTGKTVDTFTETIVTNATGSALIGTGVDIAIGFTNPTKAISKLGKFCFTEGTQVVVGAEYDENDVFVQYVTVNIEDIKVGDFVYSYDTITGTTELKEVTDVFVREADHINYLTIVDEYGNVQIIETTDGHPFWVVTDEPDLERAAREVVDENGVILYHENIAPGLNGFWVEAKDLREGDVFVGANGELSTLVDFERVVFPDGIKVYNFTVDGNHNYFVIAKDDPFGQTCILVHNAGGIYEFNDLKKSGKVYVGQAKTFKTRLPQHKSDGRINDVKDVATTEMKNANKLAREIAEHKRIQEITKGVPAKKSDLVSNMRDPIGPKRAHLLKGDL